MTTLRTIWRFLTLPRGLQGHPFYGAARRRGSRRGVALLMAITTIAFMTILVTEINYTARVRLVMSAHGRDEAGAYWLARSGVGLYQLILIADRQMADQGIPSTYGALWQLIPPINTPLMRMLLVGGGSVDEDEVKAMAQAGQVSDEIAEESREESRFADKGFLDFEGDFYAEITDEEQKINVSMLGKSCEGGVCSFATLQQDPMAQALFGLMSGQENDQWFYERNLDRWELIANLTDWIDLDTTRCTAQGGYEDSLYQRFDPPYLSKNGPFDTMEEIRLVEGWQDDVMDRFGANLTLYGDGKINLLTASPEMLETLLKTHVTPPPTDFELERLVQQWELDSSVLIPSKPKDFVDWIKNQSLTLLDEQKLQNAIKFKSSVFTVQSTGQVGDTSASITAVFDFSSSAQGRVRYWRVE